MCRASNSYKVNTHIKFLESMVAFLKQRKKETNKKLQLKKIIKKVTEIEFIKSINF